MDSVVLATAEAMWEAVDGVPEDGSDLSAINRASEAIIKQIPQEVLKIVDNCFYGPAQQQMKMLLWLMARRFPMLLLGGRLCLTPQWPLVLSFPELPVHKRQLVLRSWARSPLAPLRKAYKGLKALVASAILSSIDPVTGTSPTFQAMGYTPGPLREEPFLGPLPAAAQQVEEVLASATVHLPELVAKAADVQSYLTKRGFCTAPGQVAAVGAGAKHDQGRAGSADNSRSSSSHESGHVELWYDAVIVGSGAGGGVTAALLAGAGLKVLVLEKAAWVRRRDMTWLEADAHAEMYDRAGFLTTQDGAISILAGSTLGGGTKINWTASLETPDHVRREWAAAPHNLALLGPGSQAFTDALKAVCARLGVSNGTTMSGPNQRLLQGLQELGVHGEELPRNCLSKTCSAYCSFGCRSGHKQSSDVTWLVDAVRAGAHVLTGVAAERVLLAPNQQQNFSSSSSGVTRAKRAVGVAALSSPRITPGAAAANLPQLRVTVHAPLVVASCGSIHTPALLLRSGVRAGGNVGRHLRLHPAVGLVGFFQPTAEQQAAGRGAVNMYEGVSMGSFSRAAANWSEGGYGAMVSVPAVHPGLLGAISPDSTPGALKQLMLQVQHGSASVIFTRDTGSGSVGIDSEGRPVVRYWPDDTTSKHLLDGVVLAARALVAAGACRIVVPNDYDDWDLRLDLTAPAEQRAEQLEAFVARMRASGVHPKYGLQLLSAHQMGSCRMGSSPRSSVCDADGECWDVAGLHVADGSLFPTASGVNPMITIYGLSYMVAGRIAERWKAARKANGTAAS